MPLRLMVRASLRLACSTRGLVVGDATQDGQRGEECGPIARGHRFELHLEAQDGRTVSEGNMGDQHPIRQGARRAVSTRSAASSEHARGAV